MKGIFKLGIVLMLVCLASAVFLFAVNSLTRGRIENQAQSARLASLRIVLPACDHFSNLQNGKMIDYYTGHDVDGAIAGYAFIGAAWGYSSTIEVMVGVDNQGEITGINILKQNETPGLGDKAVKLSSERTIWEQLSGGSVKGSPSRPWFQAQFSGKRLGGLKVVKNGEEKYIQALSGATITSRAVTQAVGESMKEFFRQGTIEVTGGER